MGEFDHSVLLPVKKIVQDWCVELTQTICGEASDSSLLHASLVEVPRGVRGFLTGRAELFIPDENVRLLDECEAFARDTGRIQCIFSWQLLHKDGMYARINTDILMACHIYWEVTFPDYMKLLDRDMCEKYHVPTYWLRLVGT